MFTGIRLRLVGSIAAVLALVLLLTGAFVYSFLTHRLDAAVDIALRRATARIITVAVLPADGAGPTDAAGLVMAPASGSIPVAGTAIGTTPEFGLASPSGTIAEAETESTADETFVLSIVDGQILTRYGAVPAGMPHRPALETATRDGEVFSTVVADGQRYRLLTRTTSDGAGRTALVMQAGMPLTDRDRQQQIVLLALAGGGAVGLALTVAGGLLLTRRLLAPVQEAFDRQQQFVSDASHELRTPLALVRLEAESLARRLDALGEARPLLQQVDRLSRLVADLLTLAQLDERAPRSEPASLPVAPLLRAAAVTAERLAAPDVTVTVAAPPDLALWGDPDRLRRVLLILIDNACRATPAGGRIALHAAPDDRMVAIRVEDSGPGIPREHLVRVFERFYRVDVARSSAEGGAGLGLAIARGIVIAHGWTITLASEPGRGTVATLRLPVDHPGGAP